MAKQVKEYLDPGMDTHTKVTDNWKQLEGKIHY